ncbi:hypothetical protein F5Y14DRAFT_200638 [Nemania sp. NC0429]|nr:hypothetical protein F5Y14DRAFT_200638 [Nemania sp. NC0429]
MKLHELKPEPKPGESGSKQIDADVVFVHGLMGHFEDTWRAEDGTVWPNKLLPQSLYDKEDLNIRVLSFEYGGSIRGTTSQAGIDDTAQNLLQYLYHEREKQRDQERPIIFVGHSLGGVIIKRAIRIAYNNDMFRSIKIPISGVTPGVFDLITQDFRHLFRDLSLQTFQEVELKEPLHDLVVNQTLGLLDPEGRAGIPISGNHLSLCKFKKDEPGKETEFDSVRMRIGEMIKQSSWYKRNRLEAVNSLCSETLCQSMMSNKLAYGTGMWIFNRPQFSEWLHRMPGKSELWITGETGCGKSYIAKQVVDTLRGQNESVICAFLREKNPTDIDLRHLMSNLLEHALEIDTRLHLRPKPSQEISSIRPPLLDAQKQVLAIDSQWDQDLGPTENNLHGLLASTIRQVMIEITPESIDTDLIPIWKSENPPHRFNLDEVKKLWPKIMAKTLKKCPITAVVDGFDTMERQDQETFLQIFKESQEQLPEPGRFRLLCFSSDYPDLNSDLQKGGFVHYRIDKARDTGSDIKEGVKQRMNILNRIHRYTPEMQKTIEEGVPKAADGTYLQADLILGSLKRTKYDKDALSQLLGAPSQGNAVLYDHILGNTWADSATRRAAKHILTWITFQKEGLSPTELGIARALAKTRDNIHRESIDYDKACDLREDDTELWVNRFLGHLVKLEHNRFQLIHPSLMKYLITQPEQLDDEYGDNVQLPYHADSYMNPSASNALLGNLCATYLARSCFDHYVRPRSGSFFAWQRVIEERMREHPFLRYAALHWSEHLRLAQALSLPGSSSSRVMAADRERHEKLAKHAESWLDVQCYFHDHAKSFPDLCSASDRILHRSYTLKQIPTEEVGQSSTLHTHKTRLADTTQSSLRTEQPTRHIEQPTPPTEQLARPTALLTPRSELPAPAGSRIKRTQKPHQQQGMATPSKGSSRRNHWLVRGAQVVVDKLHLEKGEQLEPIP